MAEKNSLLAHLAYRIAGGAENAAVEALAYILNGSETVATSFNILVSRAAAVDVEACTRFQTQVTAEDNSRPDLVGYDRNREKRVIGEAKFWASLGEGQAMAYLDQLPSAGPSVLLFVVPGVRSNRLWTEVMTDVSRAGGWQELPSLPGVPETRSAAVTGDERRLVMVSWTTLLQWLMESAVGEVAVQEDIRQLLGLARRIDSDEFKPFRKEELAPELPRRVLDLARLVNDALVSGSDEGWISPLGTRWSRGTDDQSSGWYLKFTPSEEAAWFGTYFHYWAQGGCEDTPLWLQLYRAGAGVLQEVEQQLGVKPADDINFPIRLRPGDLYDDVLADVVSQLRVVAKAIDAVPTDA